MIAILESVADTNLGTVQLSRSPILTISLPCTPADLVVWGVVDDQRVLVEDLRIPDIGILDDRWEFVVHD